MTEDCLRVDFALNMQLVLKYYYYYLLTMAQQPYMGLGLLFPRFRGLKVKQSHYRPGRPLVFQEVEALRFLDSRHMKVVRSSALRTGCLYPQEILLVLISVRG
jgi:hypothetical protein